jgi:hypothetical protein
VCSLISCVLAVIAILETVGRRSVNEIQVTLAEVRTQQSSVSAHLPE